MSRHRLPLALLLALPGALHALPALELPDGAERVHAERDEAAQVELPTRVFRDGSLPTRGFDGPVETEVWRTPEPLDPSGLAQNLKAQLSRLGYVAGFDCTASLCGGYDFRYALEVVPEPTMHVDLGNYHYIGRFDPQTGAAVSVLLSTSPANGYLQIRHAARAPAEAGTETTVVATDAAAEPRARISRPVAEQIDRYGAAVLEDLTFETGSASLADVPSTALSELAAYLGDKPEARVLLVGHTDAEGSLEGNIALSRSRAEAVRQRLIDEFGVTSGQLTADGVGYMAPRTTNTTDDGRRLNRRVEAVLVAQ